MNTTSVITAISANHYLILSAILFSIGMAGVISETPLSYDSGKIVLTIPPSYAGLDGERLRRRFESLANLLDRQAEIRVHT